MTGVDIVYANLAGDLEQMAKHIVEAMREKGCGDIPHPKGLTPLSLLGLLFV